MARHERRFMKVIGEMSLQEIVFFLKGTEDTLPLSDLSSLTKRLYEIAFFDHHISNDTRLMATQVLKVVKKTVEKSLEDNPDALAQYGQANQYMEDNVPLFGYGALGWLLEEEQIPDAEVVSYLLRSEHGHLLQNFLRTMGDKTKEATKQAMIKELVLSRRYQDVSNAIAILYGLAAKKDAATVAIFSPEDLDSFLHAPENYPKARNVLVRYELLPTQREAVPLFPQPEIGTLAQMVLLSCSSDPKFGNPVLWEEDTVVRSFFESLDGEKKALVGLSTIILKFSLWLSIIDGLYGEQAGTAVKNEVWSKLTKSEPMAIDDWFRAVELAKTISEKSDNNSLDFLLAYGSLTVAGLSKDFDEMTDADNSFLNSFSDLLNKERTRSFARFRFYLRYFIRPPHHQLEKLNEEALQRMASEYVVRGGFVGPAERALYFEDWLGLQ